MIRMTMTKLRHMAATLVSGLLPDEDKRDLARLMQHSSKTQQNTYNNCMATNRNIRMSKILRSVCTTSKIESSDLEPAQFGTCYCFFLIRTLCIMKSLIFLLLNSHCFTSILTSLLVLQRCLGMTLAECKWWPHPLNQLSRKHKKTPKYAHTSCSIFYKWVFTYVWLQVTSYDPNIDASSDDTDDDDGSTDSKVQATSNDTDIHASSDDASDDNCSMDCKVWYWWKGVYIVMIQMQCTEMLKI